MGHCGVPDREPVPCEVQLNKEASPRVQQLSSSTWNPTGHSVARTAGTFPEDCWSENLSTHRPRWEKVEWILLFSCAPPPPKYQVGQKVHMGFHNILWKNLNELLGHLLASPKDGDSSCHPPHLLIKIQGSIILRTHAAHCYVHIHALYQRDQKLLHPSYHLYVKCLFPFIHPLGQPTWLREFLLAPLPVLIWILLLVWGQCSVCPSDSDGEHNWKM